MYVTLRLRFGLLCDRSDVTGFCRKEDSEGHIRPVTVEDWSAFPETGRVGPLSISDIHRCVQYAMESVHFPE